MIPLFFIWQPSWKSDVTPVGKILKSLHLVFSSICSSDVGGLVGKLGFLGWSKEHNSVVLAVA